MAAKAKAPAKPAESKPEAGYDRCYISTGAERQCWFPADFYGVRATPGTGWCRLHDACKVGAGVDEIIEESIAWRDLRRAGKEVPMTYTLANGRKVPGYPTREQLERAHREWLAKPCAPRREGVRIQTSRVNRALAAGNALPPEIRQPGED